MSLPRLPRKTPSEIKLLTLPFGDQIAAGKTIVQYQVLAVSVDAGVDATPELVVDGAGVIDQATRNVYQRIKGGLVGCDYFVDTLAIDSDACRHSIQFVLPVRARIT